LLGKHPTALISSRTRFNPAGSLSNSHTQFNMKNSTYNKTP